MTYSKPLKTPKMGPPREVTASHHPTYEGRFGLLGPIGVNLEGFNSITEYTLLPENLRVCETDSIKFTSRPHNVTLKSSTFTISIVYRG